MEVTRGTMVEVRNAFKKYDAQTVICDNLNITVAKGTIYTLLGPSGCGKTTLLKCIIGRKILDSGEIFLGIKSISQIGYMPQETALVGEITIEETLNYFSWIYNMSKNSLEQRKKELFDFLEMPPESRKVEQLSGGQKRRVSLCIALLHNPEFMILDEPTVGIDPILCENIWNCLIEMSAVNHKTIIITTHYIEEARKGDKIGMMRRGVIVAEGEPSAIMNQYDCSTLEEVFIHLCIKQEKEISEIESKTKANYPKTNVKPKIPLSNEKLFSFNKLFGFILKSFYTLKFSFLFIFLTFLFPVSSSLCFQWTVGHDPNNLKVGVVNDELICKNADCYQFSNVSCCPASCEFINVLERKLEVITYKDIIDARYDFEKNHIVGFFNLSANFTESLYQRISLQSRAPDADVDLSEVAVWIDTTNQIIANYLKNYIYFSYFDLLDRLSLKCEWQVHHSKIPINIKEPVYGKNIPDFNDFSVNALIILLEFFLPIGYAITILQDKIEGILERNLTSGLTYLEIVIGHTIGAMLLFIIQITCIMVIVYVIYDHVYEGSMLLTLSFSILVGFCGMWYGLFIAMLCNDFVTATFLTMGSNIIFTSVAGLFWPIEGMYPLLYSLKWTFPLTPAAEAYRSITARAWSLSHPQVYNGFLSVLGWTGVYVVGTYIVIKVKKGVDIR